MNHISNSSFSTVTTQIRQLIEQSRHQVAQSINISLLNTYWKIGLIIIEEEQTGKERAQYGKQLITHLAKSLSQDIGKGFSRSNLHNMRNFYLAYPIFQTLSGKLSWSHYCELIAIPETDKRSFYEKECEQSNWSVRELKRQINTSLFERLLLSTGKANQEKVLALAKEDKLSTSQKIC